MTQPRCVSPNSQIATLWNKEREVRAKINANKAEEAQKQKKKLNYEPRKEPYVERVAVVVTPKVRIPRPIVFCCEAVQKKISSLAR